MEKVEHGPAGKARPVTNKSRRPLEGIRVLDIGTIVAGPFVGTLLGDFGAEVIKIEPPGEGDPGRDVGLKYKGVGLAWVVESRNKKSVTLDLRKPEGQNVLKELVAVCDILVENFRPGTLEKWNLGYDVLRAVNRGLIMVRVSGYGQEGPYRDRAGYDRMAQAMGGLMYLTGYPEMPPVRTGLAICDNGTGLFGAFGALLALYYRDTLGGGEGQVVDCALYETALRMYSNYLAAYDKLGIVSERGGHVRRAAIPGDLFQTRDGKHVLISCVGNRMFANLARAIGREELAADPRYDTTAKRGEQPDVLNAIVHQWVSDRTLGEVMDELLKNEVAVAPLYSAKDIAEDEHFRLRGSVIEVEDPVVGRIKMQGVVPKLSATPGSVESTGPALGEHTRQVLSTLLGYSDEKIEKLRTQRLI